VISYDAVHLFYNSDYFLFNDWIYYTYLSDRFVPVCKTFLIDMFFFFQSIIKLYDDKSNFFFFMWNIIKIENCHDTS